MKTFDLCYPVLFIMVRASIGLRAILGNQRLYILVGLFIIVLVWVKGLLISVRYLFSHFMDNRLKMYYLSGAGRFLNRFINQMEAGKFSEVIWCRNGGEDLIKVNSTENWKRKLERMVMLINVLMPYQVLERIEAVADSECWDYFIFLRVYIINLTGALVTSGCQVLPTFPTSALPIINCIFCCHYVTFFLSVIHNLSSCTIMPSFDYFPKYPSHLQ